MTGLACWTGSRRSFFFAGGRRLAALLTGPSAAGMPPGPGVRR
jgi:hypothetical protein